MRQNSNRKEISVSCRGVMFYYAGLIKHLSHSDWPPDHACTYVSWHYTDSSPGNLHDHDFPELLWVESGRGCHLINGQRQIIQTGDLLLIRPEDVHGFAAWKAGEPLHFINFAFRPALWENLQKVCSFQKLRYFDMPALEKRKFQIGPEERERLRLMAADIAVGRWTPMSASAFLFGALALLENLGTASPPSPVLPDWLARSSRAIQRWPHFLGGVPEFVHRAGRSHEHVSRECRRLLGISPRELVNRARLKWAAMQLETTEKKIVDIASECGFDNLGHFYKLFRSQHRRTPRSYRLHFGIRERE